MDLGSMKLDLFHQAKTKESVKRLEGAVEVGLNLLDNIKSTITSAKEISAVANFLKSIDDVKASYSSRKPIIGVVGGTGTGKSSLINALLDHEALVPTSGIGACTAVITEIQYNHSSNENEKYRAEVEFIKAAEWEKELRILLDDISSAGPTNIDINSESNVAVAYNKLVTLYPDISKDDLLKGKHTAQSLAHDPSVAQLLGSTAKVSASTSEELLESLEEYIASKKKDASMAYWPLVKVVRIFAKVSVLESGLVIVDLPGTQDSNAARSAVAAKYVEKCTGLWVITPIIRATDDKTAQKLMGQSFRRQMQIDGTYSVVTFICSKTDDLSVTEMLRAMPEGEKAKAINEKLANLGLELKKLEEEPRSIKSRIAELSKLIENREKDIRFLEAATAGENSNEEKINFTSAETGIKRKQRAAAVVARKRAQRTHDESEDSDSSDSSEEELETTDGDNEELLTLEEACERIKKLKEEQAAAWDEKAAQKKKSDPLKKKKNEVQEEIKELKLLLPFECLQFRNRYSTRISSASSPRE